MEWKNNSQICIKVFCCTEFSYLSLSHSLTHSLSHCFLRSVFNVWFFRKCKNFHSMENIFSISWSYIKTVTISFKLYSSCFLILLSSSQSMLSMKCFISKSKSMSVGFAFAFEAFFNCFIYVHSLYRERECDRERSSASLYKCNIFFHKLFP